MRSSEAAYILLHIRRRKNLPLKLWEENIGLVWVRPLFVASFFQGELELGRLRSVLFLIFAPIIKHSNFLDTYTVQKPAVQTIHYYAIDRARRTIANSQQCSVANLTVERELTTNERQNSSETATFNNNGTASRQKKQRAIRLLAIYVKHETWHWRGKTHENQWKRFKINPMTQTAEVAAVA